MSRQKYLGATAVALLGLLAAIEGVCRWGLGLGNPPLSVTHPTIEYMFRPDSVCRRFGRVFKTNHYGMRSEALTPDREANELRILVLGDSIPNGGSLTDQNDLASELVRRALTDTLARPVAVGNISAGTWSPPNLLAYVEAFGTFDADLAVIVLNGEDLDDVPTFEPLNPRTHPTRKPRTAVGELLSRYLWPRLAAACGGRTGQAAAPPPADARARCVAALEGLIDRLRADGVGVVILYHPFRRELRADETFVPDDAYDVIREVARRHGALFRSMAPRYQRALADGVALYRDGQHLTAEGQGIMAEEMIAAIRAIGGAMCPWQ